MKFASKALVTWGIFSILFGLYLIWQRSNPLRISFENPTVAVKEVDEAKQDSLPVKIKIESRQIELPIIPQKLIGTNWQVTDKGVTYLTDSPIPGKVGNSILYGHNWTKLLGNLTLVTPGDIIEIAYANGEVKNFKVTNTQVVDPSQVSILKNTTDKRITIYTCTGLLDTKRFVVVAETS